MTCVMPIGRSSVFRLRWGRQTAPSRAFSIPECIVMSASCASWATRRALVCALFARYSPNPDDMRAEGAQPAEAGDEAGRLRRTADFIAGMTDRYALVEHARLFDST